MNSKVSTIGLVRCGRSAQKGVSERISFSNDWSVENGTLVRGDGDGDTDGWISLGFNGLDYTVDVQGDEDAGDYVTTVTYTMVNP